MIFSKKKYIGNYWIKNDFYYKNVMEMIFTIKIYSNEVELISLHVSIAIVSTQLNGFTYCYLTLLDINYLFACSEVVTTIVLHNTNNSILAHSWRVSSTAIQH